MSQQFVFWEVDAQRDFMLPGGALYVPGAERIIPHIHRLVQAAATSHTLLVSSACAHSENDPEFQIFPPHCIKGTAGAEIIVEGMTKTFTTIPNDPSFSLPSDILAAPQIVIEKQALDVFSNPHTAALVDRIGPGAKYVVFGVVTEYCVRCASEGLLERGGRIYVVGDAIETLKADEGLATLDHLKSRGAGLITTAEALEYVMDSRH